jgi:pSer/pThr/pTyr-binding forkhead associated (FHA) protein
MEPTQRSVGGPLDPHAARPAELRERLLAERRGMPFLVYRDGADRQQIVELAAGRERLLIGRSAGCDVCLDWDPAVSRVHAELVRAGDDWVVADDGLSSNGTFVGSERVVGRRRLADGDRVTVGDTLIAIRMPAARSLRSTLRIGGPAPELTPAQRRVLVALCRPFREAADATPASNRRIAEELVVTPDAVKRTLRTLFVLFEVGGRPQNEKRAALARKALQTRAVARHEL